MDYKRNFTLKKGGIKMNAMTKLLVALAFFASGCSSSYYATDYSQDDVYSSANESPSSVSGRPSADDYSQRNDYYNNGNNNNQEYRQNDSANENYQDNQGYSDNSQPDYSTSDQSYNDGGNTYITNNYYNDDFDYDNYYDYSYAARLRRFHHPFYGAGYYDSYYTNSYWYDYDPFLYGTSIYLGYYWWRPSPWISVSWGWGWYPYHHWGGYNPWNYYNYYDPWGYYSCNYWGWGYPSYGWGYGNGYWHGYQHGYWNGYWDGYNDAMYYNSYDNNSGFYYYGHRDASLTNSGNSYAYSFAQKYREATGMGSIGNKTNVSRTGNTNNIDGYPVGKETIGRTNPGVEQGKVANPDRQASKTDSKAVGENGRVVEQSRNNATQSKERCKP